MFVAVSDDVQCCSPNIAGGSFPWMPKRPMMTLCNTALARSKRLRERHVRASISEMRCSEVCLLKIRRGFDAHRTVEEHGDVGNAASGTELRNQVEQVLSPADGKRRHEGDTPWRSRSRRAQARLLQ